MNREQIEAWRVSLKRDGWAAHSVDELCDLALRGLEAQSSRSQLRRTAAQKGEPMPEFGGAGEPIDIVFDGPPSHEAPRFVEVESPPGKSIRFGKWLQRDDGYWVLRFNAPPADGVVVPIGLQEILEEAASIINGDKPRRFSIVDELYGYAAMLSAEPKGGSDGL